MIRRTLACMLTLGLVACATPPSSPPPSPETKTAPPARDDGHKGPAEAAPEAAAAAAPPVDLTPVPFEVARANFIRNTAARHGLEPAYITSVLDQAQVRQPIIAAMARPAERVKPWNEYRPMFITPARIEGGRKFLAQHRDELMRVQQRTGVPAEVIVAIIGVETSYGANTGSHRVLDALYTLAFYYPRSGDPAKLEREVRRELFFRDELANLFVLARDEKLDITGLKGSYAGAMGMGQFMPSSYLDYAVDGNGDGRRDLFTSYDDVFSSIANYFVKKGGWVRGGQVAVPATLAAGREEFNPTEWAPTWSLDELARRGYQPSAPVQPGATATLVTLEGSTGKQYWLGFQNYYAITRYNISKMYAMSVFQLSQAIAGQELPPA